MKHKLAKTDQTQFNGILKEFGSKFKQIRKAKGLKQIDFWDEPYPIEQKNIQKIESGQVNATLQTLFVIAKKAGCSLHVEIRPIEPLSRSKKG